MNREYSGYDSYGMRPATLQERLEKIRNQIKITRNYIEMNPDWTQPKIILDDLLNREAILLSQIKNQTLSERPGQAHVSG